MGLNFLVIGKIKMDDLYSIPLEPIESQLLWGYVTCTTSPQLADQLHVGFTLPNGITAQDFRKNHPEDFVDFFTAIQSGIESARNGGGTSLESSLTTIKNLKEQHDLVEIGDFGKYLEFVPTQSYGSR